MIMLLVNLTQQRMSDRLMYLPELECTVLEVKVIEGLGTTIDAVLSNGIIHEGDKIVVWSQWSYFDSSTSTSDSSTFTRALYQDHIICHFIFTLQMLLDLVCLCSS